MTKAAAKTGVGPTTLVAIEQNFPENERIITDNLAYQILPWSVKVFVWLTRVPLVRNVMVQLIEKDAPGIWGGILCRKRYIDEKLADSVSYIDEIVNMGAGFDTRIYRLSDLSKICIWELDQPENIKLKRNRLIDVLGIIPAHIKLVPIDFDREDLSNVLKSQGYSTKTRTFFILEAVTQYLTEEGIRTIFDFLEGVAPGSRLAFTYVLKDFIDGRNMYGWKKGYKRYVTNKIWIFGMEPESWPKFLSEQGWQIIEDIGHDELAEKYVKSTGRILKLTQIERMVFAEKL